MKKKSLINLYYAHDPMCSWCWGFTQSYDFLMSHLPETVKITRLLGGLAPDSDDVMPVEMQKMLQQTWHRIEAAIPGVKFNFDFWSRCQPKRSTYIACRAVIAARLQGNKFDVLMNKAIQSAYYQQARNPSDISVLVELATEINIDASLFAEDLVSEKVQRILLREINLCRDLYLESFPSLALVTERDTHIIAVDYHEPVNMINEIEKLL